MSIVEKALSPGHPMSKKTKDRIKAVVYHTFVALSCFIMLYPILWMIASSLKERRRYGLARPR